MSQVRIQAKHLIKKFGQNTAINDLSLAVTAGEIYGLVGPDGAGKTTTLRLLAGATWPNSGEVWIEGIDLLRHPENARACLGYLSQRFSLYEDLTVWENLQFFAQIRNLDESRWGNCSREILEFVGLQAFTSRLSKQLSGGMKQKLALAVALVNEPSVLLLDEPTTGVDAGTRQDFWQLLVRIVARDGVAVLLCTPYMDEASRCTRVGFLREGKLIVEGTPDILRESLHGRIAELTGTDLQALAHAATLFPEFVKSVQRFGDRLHLRLATNLETKLAEIKTAIIDSGTHVDRLEWVEPELEDVFIALTEEAK